MDSIVDKIDRRRFFGTAAMVLAATQLGMIGPGERNGGRQKFLQASQEQTPPPDR